MFKNAQSFLPKKYSHILFPPCFLPDTESVSLSRIEGAFHLYEDSLELKNNEDERLTAEIKQMGNMVSVLQKELSETKETKLQLEHQKIEWELELRRLRYDTLVFVCFVYYYT